jgi:transcriptional regulator with XRE-family HTH domain
MATKKWYGESDLVAKFGKMTLGKSLVAFREAEEMSQNEFGKKLGLSRANLCDIEKGRKIPSPKRASKIAKTLGVPEKVLLELSIQDMLTASHLDYRVELLAA